MSLSPKASPSSSSMTPFNHDFATPPSPSQDASAQSSVQQLLESAPQIASPRQRTANACTKCRERKTKCSGDKPICQRCAARGLVCVYTKELKHRQGSSMSRAGPSQSSLASPSGSWQDTKRPERHARHPSIQSYSHRPPLTTQVARFQTNQHASQPNSPVESVPSPWSLPFTPSAGTAQSASPTSSAAAYLQPGPYNPATIADNLSSRYHASGDPRRVKSLTLLQHNAYIAYAHPELRSMEPYGTQNLTSTSTNEGMHSPQSQHNFVANYQAWGWQPNPQTIPQSVSSWSRHPHTTGSNHSDSGSTASLDSLGEPISPSSPTPNASQYMSSYPGSTTFSSIPSHTDPLNTPPAATGAHSITSGTDSSFFYGYSGTTSHMAGPLSSEGVGSSVASSHPILVNPSPRTPIHVAKIEQLIHSNATTRSGVESVAAAMATSGVQGVNAGMPNTHWLPHT
ncbi:hypothetical protein DL96DRAFT_1681129 [Flagelloscypha sp. PMI_526]|nr:hypothetical protein DL96DRAFT_1681129 [Flagelloscypha sp. PMI_526]